MCTTYKESVYFCNTKPVQKYKQNIAVDNRPLIDIRNTLGVGVPVAAKRSLTY